MKTLFIIAFAFYAVQGMTQSTQQKITKEDILALPTLPGSTKAKHVPITYQIAGTPFTDTLRISGVIAEQSSAGFYCGVICHSGTMKVQVDETSDVVYVLIPCFVHDEKDLGKQIDLKLTNLPEDRYIGCYRNVWNTIDSEGEAFYYCESYLVR